MGGLSLCEPEGGKSPAELEDTIKESQKTIELAPTWPTPYYNLGFTQEKAGTFREAIAS